MANAYAPAIAPLAVALTLAHYAWSILLESQTLLIQLSDPFQRGWDLIGTVDHELDYEPLSVAQVAWAQLAVVVAGHVATAVVVHDRALAHERAPVAARVEYPLVALLVVSATGGLALVLAV